MAAGDKKQKKGPCVYCRMEGLIKADHVPPRSFYPALTPKNLITVPSCEGCNKLFALDDDYVRLVFISAEGAIGNPARDAVLPTVQRFSERKQSKNILSSFYSSLQSGYYPTAAGVLTTRQSFLIDGERLDAFAKRTVKALFYREKGYPLPGDCTINALYYRGFEEARRLAGNDANFYSFILTELIDRSPRHSWGDAFAYSWVQSPNDVNATWWLLEFYGKRLFLCNTLAASPAPDPSSEAKD